jgi:hypothetical protein
MTSTRQRLKGGLASAALLTTVSANAVTLGSFNNTTVTIGGYVKLDAMFTDFSDGTVDGSSPGRDFYIPSVTPVGGTSENTVFDMHARQTRIHLATDSKIGEQNLKSYIEVDFMVNPLGDERISNSYAPRLRHAYISYGKWLFGQTWSTFQNVASLPETVDFIGNTDAGIFIRQPQIRYTRDNWQFSIENPETTVTPNGGGTRIVADDNELPDFVGRYNYQNKDLSLVGAVLLRQLSYNDTGATPAGSVNDSTPSWGISLTGKYLFANKDDIRFGINVGSGMGRYIGLNVSNGAVVDNNSQLEAIDSLGLFASYRHLWNAKWRSNLTYSRIDIDNNTALTGTSATKATASARANVFYDWVENLTLGGELALANREIETGADGSMTRLQFMAMYKF